MAAQGEGASSDGAASGGVGDIIVTATRRAENLQDVPVTISAVSAESLSSAGVSTTRGLEQVVAGLVMATTATSTQPTLRGIGTRSASPGEESNIAMYLDGVYQPAMTSNNFELINVERVEVLKGPQGALYGRNATGGAINIVTSKPSDELAGRFALSFGRFNEVNAGGYVSVPLGAGLAVDLAANRINRDGYVDDLVRGGKLGRKKSHSLRGRIRFQPTEDIDIIAAISDSSTDDNSIFTVQPINGNTIGRQIDPNVLLPTKPRQYVGNIYPRSGFDQREYSLQAQFDLGFAVLESVGNIQKNTNYYTSDSEGTVIPGRDLFAVGDYMDAWTEEVRLISQGSGRLQWIVGALAFGSKAALDPLVVNNPTSTTLINGRQKAKAYAGYAEATYEVLDSLFVTGGLRYSSEKRTFTPFVNTVRPTVSATFKDWTPRASIRYEFSPDANLYFTYSEGFKSGVYNIAAAGTVPVRPETITSYEVGLKLQPASWLRTNISGFIYDYKDLQVSARLSGNTVAFLQNAGAAKIKGIDLDIAAYPVDGLSLNLAAALLDTKFTEFAGASINVPTLTNGVALGGNASIIADVSGNELVRAPKFTATAGFAYEFEAASGRVKLGANANYNDGYFLEFGNRLRQPSYVLVNANLGWWTRNERLGITLWAENITGEDVVQYALISGNQDGYSYRPPATYGVRLNFNY
jgi:iron complex outermembrane receptor protein